MRIEIDMKNKILTLLEDVSLDKLYSLAEKLGEPTEWTIKKSEEPITWYPTAPLNPYNLEPDTYTITCTDSGLGEQYISDQISCRMDIVEVCVENLLTNHR